MRTNPSQFAARQLMLAVAVATVLTACVVSCHILRDAAVSGIAGFLGAYQGDPGCAYAPLNASGEKVGVWSQTVSGVRFEQDGFTSLIPLDDVYGSLRVFNRSDSDVELLYAVFEGHGRSFVARNEAGHGRQTVPRKERGEFLLLWNLNGLTGDQKWDLGKRIAWEYRVRIGNEKHTIRIPMEMTSHTSW
jgi:hypothetical protein